MAEAVPQSRMTPDQLEAYIASCFAHQDQLGEHYVRRQVEWADAELRQKLAQGEGA